MAASRLREVRGARCEVRGASARCKARRHGRRVWWRAGAGGLAASAMRGECCLRAG